MKAVVIGAGAAGTAACLALREAGAAVTVLDAAWGATSACSGAWDVATVTCRDALWDESIADRIARIAESRPSHPYARIDEPVETVARVHEAFFAAIGGYSSLDLSSPGVRVSTDRGVVARVGSTDENILALDGVPGGLVAVASLRGHPSADGSFLARGLSADGGANDLSFVDVAIEYFGRRSDALVWPHEAAALGDAEDARARLSSVLRRALPERRPHAWLLPPLLGLTSAGVVRGVSELVGRPVGEVALGGVGPQGTRLARRLAAARERAGVEERRTRAARAAGGRVHLSDGDVLEADAVILATGSALAGGIAPKGDGLEEPLTKTDVAFGAWGRWMAPAQAFSSGVRWDGRFRLLGRDDSPADGVFVCGALLEGVSHADGTGLGAAVTTGWLAAEAALAG